MKLQRFLSLAMPFFIGLTLFMSCTSSPITISDAPPLAVTDYDPTHQALKTRIVRYLTSIGASDSLIIGQNIGHADGFILHYDMMNRLQQTAGASASILGLDLGFDDFQRDWSRQIEHLDSHWKNGGLITLSFHPANPTSLQDSWDKTPVSPTELISPGTEINRRWRTMLQNVANVLQELKNRHIIVLWRPLHEMNGGWFWWGNDKAWFTASEFRSIWIDMHRFLTIEKKLDNILFVYSPNYKYSPSQKDTDYYYPGSEYVDVISIDYYNDTLADLNLFGGLDKLSSLGKPIGMESGPNKQGNGSFSNLTYLGHTASPIAYVLVWHSWENNRVALIDCQHLSEFFANPRVITLPRLQY